MRLRAEFLVSVSAVALLAQVSASGAPAPSGSASSATAAPSASASAGAVDDAVIVRVGDRVVTAATLRRALTGVPTFELMSLGTSRSDILRKYVDEAIVREELLAAAARKKGAETDRSVQLQIKKALAASIVRKELGAMGNRDAIPAEDVKAYYDAHVNEYKTPERVRVWHLVVATKEQAEAALAKAKADPTREGWPKLVSEVSLDPVTRRSNGDLGFVTAEARTNESKVVVPKAVADAAFKLKDGEMSPAPVQSDAGWHVLWRRGSTPATVRTLLDETPTIRELLYEQKRDATYKALVARLRGQTKIETDEEQLNLVAIDVPGRPPNKMPQPMQKK